jgi:hypothetical protein
LWDSLLRPGVRLLAAELVLLAAVLAPLARLAGRQPH